MLSSGSNESVDDLSAGSLPGNANFLTEDLLEERSQERRYKRRSFYLAWGIALAFLGSVLCFSYRIIFNPSQYWPLYGTQKNLADGEPRRQPPASPNTTSATGENPQQITDQQPKSAPNHSESESPHSTNPINQILILLGLLSAIGTTLAISVMRFSFSGNGNGKSTESNTTPTSPLLEFLKEALEVVKDVFGKQAKD